MRFPILVIAAMAGCTQSSGPFKLTPSGPIELTPIVVTDTTLTFDPATCEMDDQTLGLGLGSVRVEIVERKNAHCTFEFTHEVEGGYRVYLVSVPVDSGTVEIRAEPGGAEVTTSFELKDATIVWSGNVFFE